SKRPATSLENPPTISRTDRRYAPGRITRQDRGQVEALPAPAVQACLEPPIREITGCELMPLLPELMKLGLEIGSLVEFEELSGDRRGYYEIDSKRIAI